MTGTFHGTADFDPGSGLHILTAVGPSDGYVMRFSPSSGVPVRPTPSPGDPILPATGADTIPLSAPLTLILAGVLLCTLASTRISHA